MIERAYSLMLVARDDFKLNCSVDPPASPTAHLTRQCQIKYSAITHSGVVRRLITGIVQKGGTPCVKFITNAAVKDAPLLDYRGVWGLGVYYIPGRQVSRPTPHLRPPGNRASSSRGTFFAAHHPPDGTIAGSIGTYSSTFKPDRRNPSETSRTTLARSLDVIGG